MTWEKYDIRNLSEEEYQKWYSLMNDDKKIRVDRFRFADDKKRTVAGEMLARKMIADECKTEAEKITFEKNEYGKPFAVGLNIHFNISHTGNYVVCAINNNPIGIDIEKLRDYKPNTARRVCSDEEILLIEKSENPAEEFIKIWTKKEAFAKFSGTGLTEKSIKQNLKNNIPQYKFEDYFVSIYTAE